MLFVFITMIKYKNQPVIKWFLRFLSNTMIFTYFYDSDYSHVIPNFSTLISFQLFQSNTKLFTCLYGFIYSNAIPCPVGRVCRINGMIVCRGVRPPSTSVPVKIRNNFMVKFSVEGWDAFDQCPGNDTKQFYGEVVCREVRRLRPVSR